MAGLFQEQIEERQKSDEQALEDSFLKIAGIVLGERAAEKIADDRYVAKDAIDEILKYYHFRPVDIPDEIGTVDSQLDYCLRKYGMMKRRIELKNSWYKDAYGPVLAFLKDSGTPVALIPAALSGYCYRDVSNGKRVRINKGNVGLFDTDAFCFYTPLPQKELGITDLLLYMKQRVSIGDVLSVLMASLVISAVGLFIPRIIAALTGPVLNSDSKAFLLAACICILCISASMQLLRIVRTLLSNRIKVKATIGVESSMMLRLISLPAGFFRKYSPGEMANRFMYITSLCGLIMDMVIDTGLTAVVSLLYVTQIFAFAPALVIPSLIIILVTVGVSLATTVVQTRISKIQMEKASKEAGVSYSIIYGIQKIKLAGAEKRAFARWLDKYADYAGLTYNPPVFLKIGPAITTGISLFSTIILYYLAAVNGVEQSSYFAFMSAYGMIMGAFMGVSDIAFSMAQIKPVLEMVEPFLKSVPEKSDDKEIINHISGKVEMEHVSFRYAGRDDYVLKDFSLKINKGDYVAIVGKTGCGKSTIVRLLLGFETPETGGVFYDGKNLNTLDLASVRANIGTVTQDGSLFTGDIFSNIVLTAPMLKLKDAWEAAETAGIADDIREMPMGMNTMVSEGQGGVSGGQKQRLLIARAVVTKPKLLIFDEATSALDNLTQKKVSDSIDKMGCTRIVIAHKLSTIKNCGRIIVIDDGKIIEDGTYDELISHNGYFAELVARQQLSGQLPEGSI